MRNIFYLFILLSSVFLAACSSVYMPNVPNTPMLSSRGELHGNAHVSMKGNFSFNTAYALSENIGILLNGSIIDRNRERRDFSQNMIEAGAGYFSTFGPDKNRIFEIYAGMGKGSSERVYKDLRYEGSFPVEIQEAGFNKYFLQVNYSSKNKKALKLFGKKYPLNYGTALRTSYVNLHDFTIATPQGNVPFQKEDNIFLEPVFFTRMRISPNVQIQYTSGSNFGLKNRKYLTAGNSVFTLGAVISVGGKKPAN